MQKSNIPIHLLEWTDKLMSAFSETNSFGIAIFSVTGQLLFVNSAMNTLCSGFDSSCLINPTFGKLVSTESTEALVFSGFLTIGKMNTVNTSVEAKVFRNEGKILITGGFDVANMIEQNKTMHLLNQKVNNLQRQLMQEKAGLENTMKKLKETQQMLVHSEKMNAMGKLVAGVAHELNNPISFVYSNMHSLDQYFGELTKSYEELERLIGNDAGAELRGAVAEIRKKNELDYLFEDISDITKESKMGIERVKTIVEDLRKFSRLDESEIKQVDLIENIQSTISIARAEIHKRKIDFQFNHPPKLQIECYPGQLNQALLNVVMNAIDAVEIEGHISLTVEEAESRIIIIVKDDGYGIPGEIKDRIFEPFFTTKPVGSGTGLGLSITYKIIHDLHHGTIEIISNKGEGASFILSIPKKL